MKCREVKRQLGLADFRVFDAEGLPRGIQEHLAHCPECRRWLQRTKMCSEVMRAQASAQPAETFTQNVMARIAAENTRPNSATWFDRITGVLRPIDRSLRAYQIAAACVLLIVVIVASASHMGMIGNGNQSAISNDQVIAEGFPVAVDSPQPGIAAVSGVDAARGAAIEDLVLRHENYEMSKPLGPDAGVRFVSRTSY